ncbi:hypothetical protein FS749_005640 [Ceratobasidium sp. UAMH 11750]|nr:hypothetical protein FS749_005640 [Ceratobasidium sp. UAMH 11750]
MLMQNPRRRRCCLLCELPMTTINLPSHHDDLLGNLEDVASIATAIKIIGLVRCVQGQSSKESLATLNRCIPTIITLSDSMALPRESRASYIMLELAIESQPT